MKLKWTLLSSFLLATSMALAATLPASTPLQEEDGALEEFEEMTAQYRQFREALDQGLFALQLKTQQYDEQATEVGLYQSPQEYSAAINDPYYGYQVFILVDKSVGTRSSKVRDGSRRTPQTMYVYQRVNGQLHLVETLPVSTGREEAPQSHDTREGYMRVQSAQETYVSRKYKESMPNSLWFESEYGTAIHQTTQARCDLAIGLRASAGCIRLCPGDSRRVFDVVTQNYSRKTPIVLLEKRSGLPVARGKLTAISKRTDENGLYTSEPKVIRGYPAFVRIINGNTQDKVQEIETIIQNPTEGFKNYFRGFSSEVLRSTSI